MLLLALAACATIDPADGTYLGQVQNFTADPACETVWGVDLAALQAANATDVLLAEDRESFTLDETVDCTLFRVDFNCLEATEDRISGGANVVTRIIVVGEWVSSYAFESDWELLATCDGAGCDEVGLEEDCAINWTFDPSYAG